MMMARSSGANVSAALTPIGEMSASHLFRQRDRVIEPWKIWRFREEFLAKRDMAAVPFEDARHFTSQTSASIAKACRAEGFLRAHVIPLIDEPRCCYRAILTTDAFEALNHNSQSRDSLVLAT